MHRSSVAVVLVATVALVAAGAPQASAHEITWLGTSTGYYSVYRTTIPEGGTVPINVYRDPHCAERNIAYVDYQTTPGSAGAEDFDGRSGTVTLDPVDCPIVREVTVPTVRDSLVEDASESFSLELVNPVATRLRDPRKAEIFIIDDDGGSRAALLTTSESQYENRGRVELSVVRAGDASATATVSYATVDASATAGTDFQETSGTLTFSASQRTKRVTAELIDNAAVDGDRSFTFRLSPGSGAEVASPSETVVTILDDDSDTVAPLTRFHLPKHTKTYGRQKFKRDGMHILAQDSGSGVARIRLGVRQKLKSGGCRWWTGSKFVTRKCTKKRWISTPPSEFAIYFFPKKMAPSVGTKVKHYTAYSRATDEAGNIEGLKVGRNVVRFEIEG